MDVREKLAYLLARAEATEAAQETLQRSMAEYKARAEKADKELNKLLDEEEKVPFDPFGVTKEE